MLGITFEVSQFRDKKQQHIFSLLLYDLAQYHLLYVYAYITVFFQTSLIFILQIKYFTRIRRFKFTFLSSWK